MTSALSVFCPFARPIRSGDLLWYASQVWSHHVATSRPLMLLWPDLTFSAREAQCLEAAIAGHSYSAIGEVLGITRHTVITHIRRAMNRIGLSQVTEIRQRLAAVRVPLLSNSPFVES
jgi:DNA-binding CsgD family transcriptional regulator